MLQERSDSPSVGNGIPGTCAEAISPIIAGPATLPQAGVTATANASRRTCRALSNSDVNPPRRTYWLIHRPAADEFNDFDAQLIVKRLAKLGQNAKVEEVSDV
jgi:hypothetical protein